MYLLAICFLIAICALLYVYAVRNFGYWKNLNVPFVKPRPFFGNFFKFAIFQRSLNDTILEIYNSTAGRCIGFFLFDKPCLLVRDPEMIKHILIKDFDNFADRNITETPVDKHSANMLFVVKTPAWRNIRTKMSPIFTGGKMKRLLPLMLEVTKELKTHIKNVAVKSKNTDVMDVGFTYSMDVLSTFIYGINSHSFLNKDNPFKLAAKRMFNASFSRSLSMTAYFVAPVFVKLFGLCFMEPKSVDFFSKMFWKFMKEREASKLNNGDLIDLLLQVQKSSSEEGLDDVVLAAQAVQFIFVGYESTGSSLGFLLYSLAKNPDIQHTLRQEIQDVLEQHGSITYEALTDMKYLDGVVSESLRMFPILPFLDRRCAETYQLPGTDIVIDKGTPVYISVVGLHYDPSIYPNPDKFDPYRFMDNNAASIPPATYLPFGDGQRNCIGARFALMVIKAAVVQILTDFEVEMSSLTPDPVVFDPKAFIIYPMGGTLHLHFKLLEGVKN